jgi:hypothetical protein
MLKSSRSDYFAMWINNFEGWVWKRVLNAAKRNYFSRKWHYELNVSLWTHFSPGNSSHPPSPRFKVAYHHISNQWSKVSGKSVRFK